MADDASGKSRGLFALAVVAVLLVAALVATNLYLLLREDRSAATENAEQAKNPERAKDPIFVRVDPFTVNLQGDRFANRLLYVGLSLQVGNRETQDFLREHMPQVRSRLLILHSSQTPESLATLEGKQSLVRGILAALAEPMANQQPELLIDDVLFTEFIVQ
ncbi:flagellar basal body-associated protein FliL [Microbulbifer celer]|uniref:Flagellar protein FliL n=1 Tax=Microbulbifer celer TaxID=435905 RepID=A0ABW3U528_9GAMM|nr:flagellar basal body-associated protein FliL [Microbulbifer celer]UFN57835.1 flagellar basal body-associated protein FliL [Microbulbifer celer]